MKQTALVEIDSLACSSGGDFLLQIESLRIQPGERVAIVGHNGAGKSTLFRLLSGFLSPLTGRAQVLGRHLHRPLAAAQLRGLRGDLGQIMQGLHLVQRLSVLENVLIGSLSRVRGWRSWARCYPAHEIAAAKAALQAVGMLDAAELRSDRLSGGERQKVAIARLLMQRPKLILADEPTAALDPAAAAEVCQLLLRAADGAAIVSILHNPALIPQLADRVIGLKQGRIAFDLPVAALSEAVLADLYQQD